MNPFLEVISQRKPLAPLTTWVQILNQKIDSDIVTTLAHKLAIRSTCFSITPPKTLPFGLASEVTLQSSFLFWNRLDIFCLFYPVVDVQRPLNNGYTSSHNNNSVTNFTTFPAASI